MSVPLLYPKFSLLDLLEPTESRSSRTCTLTASRTYGAADMVCQNEAKMPGLAGATAFTSLCFLEQLSIAILVVFRLALHQVDDRLEQMVAGSQPHPNPRNVPDDDIDTRSCRPQVDRGHRTELRRSLFVCHPLLFLLRHLRIGLCRLH